jgi:hypothetical protein
MSEVLVKRTKQDGTVTLELSSTDITHHLGEDLQMSVYTLELVAEATRDAEPIETTDGR